MVCVRNKAVKEGVKSLNGYRLFITFFAYDSDITTQIKALKQRGLIKYERLGVHYQDRCLVLTELGKQAILESQRIGTCSSSMTLRANS